VNYAYTKLLLFVHENATRLHDPTFHIFPITNALGRTKRLITYKESQDLLATYQLPLDAAELTPLI